MHRVLAIGVVVVGHHLSCTLGVAQTTGRVDSSNIGVAIEDAVISSGLPDSNLDVRSFNEGIAQQLMDTASPDYPDAAAGASSQEYMIFKFDFSSLPPGASATGGASFDFSAWFTLEEGTIAEAVYGRFEFFEITEGNSDWTDRFVGEEQENPIPVTWNKLSGTFVRLANVREDDTDPPDNNSGNPFGMLYTGILVSNGGFDGANRIVDIPTATVDRLISGESVGLAMGSFISRLSASDGDYDGDNDVDGHDFLDWQQQLGAEVEIGVGADGSEDGLVDAEDLQVWENNFGLAAPAPIEGTTNFSIHTTESFLSPGSAPTLNFDWSAPAIPAASVPESSSNWFGMAAILSMRLWLARRGASGG
jgi:hypothetical protein